MKAQTTVEYMINYAWALILVVIVVSVLWQIGIFNPSTFVEKKSSGFGMFDVQDFKLDKNGNLTLILISNAEKKISNVNISTIYNFTTVSEMMPGEVKKISLIHPSHSIGESYNLGVNITYLVNGKTMIDGGRLIGKVED